MIDIMKGKNVKYYTGGLFGMPCDVSRPDCGCSFSFGCIVAGGPPGDKCQYDNGANICI